jgi:hypothetical protein
VATNLSNPAGCFAPLIDLCTPRISFANGATGASHGKSNRNVDPAKHIRHPPAAVDHREALACLQDSSRRKIPSCLLLIALSMILKNGISA